MNNADYIDMQKRLHITSLKPMFIEGRKLSFGSKALSLATVLLLSACGGGSGGAPAGNTSEANVEGRAVKGVIGDARIDVFPSNPLGQPAFSTPSESTTTEVDGSFSLTPVTEPSLVMSVGGSFVDESDQDSEGDGRKQVQLGLNDAFESVLFPGETSVAITPYTQLLVDKARREVTGDNFQQVIEKNRQIAISAFGFDPFTTTPANPIAPGNEPIAARRYALLLGGIANAINRMSIELGFAGPRFEIIEAVIADISDGTMDGLENGQAINFIVDGNNFTLPNGVQINSEIARFANNNFDAYGGLRTSVDESVLSGSGANEAPISTGNAGFNVTEGGNRTLSVADFAVSDPDSGPEALVFSISGFPVRGEIERGGVGLGSGDTFTLTELQSGDINYVDISAGAGTDTFSVFVNDGVDDITITVNVTIGAAAANQPPEFSGTLSFSVEEGSTATLNSDIVSVFDPDNGPDPLQIFLEAVPQQGVLTVAGTALTQPGPAFTPAQITNGEVVYSPNTGGQTETLEIAAGDGADTTFATITVTITAPTGNDAPVATAATFSTLEDTPVNTPLTGTDSDGSIDFVVVTILPGSVDGQLLLGNGSPVPLGSNISLADAADIDFVPTLNFNGAVSFSFTVTDNDGQVSAPADITIDVTPVNDPPQSAGTGFSVEQGHSFIFSSAIFDVSDPDNGPEDFIYTLNSAIPGRITLSGQRLLNGGSFTQANLDEGIVSFKHDGTPGNSSFDLIISDGISTGSASSNAAVPVTIAAFDADGIQYHSIFSYPEFRSEFVTGGDDNGTFDFTVGQSNARTEDNGNGLRFQFNGVGREVTGDLTTSDEVNYVARFNEEAFNDTPDNESVAITQHGELQLLLPTEREFNQNGTDEIVHARSIRFVPADLEAGITIATLQHTFEDFSTAELNGDGGLEELDVTNPLEIFQEQDLFLLTAKSGAANNDTINGDFGLMEFGFSVEDGSNGETEIFNFIGDINFDGSTGQVSGTDARSSVNRRPGRTPLLLAQAGGAEDIGSGAYSVSSDGSLTIDGGATPDGFVSPDGSLFAVIESELVDGAANNANQLNVSLILGVRRDATPDFVEFNQFRLQGYQVCYNEDGSTEAERLVRNTLSFNAGNATLSGPVSSLVRGSDAGGFAFLPIFVNSTVTLTSSVNANGRLTLTGSTAGRDVELEGYLSDTGRLMVLNLKTDDTANGQFCRGLALAVPDTGFDLDNTPPLAAISGTPTVPVATGETVELDANSSSDADGDALEFTWFATSGTLSATTGASVTYTAPSGGTSASRVYLTVSDGDFQNVTFASIVYQDPDPRVSRNQTVSVEQGHDADITNQLLQTSDSDTAAEDLIYTVDFSPVSGRLLLNGVVIGDGATFTQQDIDDSNLSYEQTGQLVLNDFFDFTVTDGNASDTGRFNLNVTPFDANISLYGLSFFLSVESNDLNLATPLGVFEAASSAIAEVIVSTGAGNQVQFENRFTGQRTESQSFTNDNTNYVLEVEQGTDPSAVSISTGVVLDSGLLRNAGTQVAFGLDDIADNFTEVELPAAGNFIPLDLKNGIFVVGSTEREDGFAAFDSTGDGTPDAIDVTTQREMDAGFFFNILGEQATGTNLSTLTGLYRTVFFEFEFTGATTGESNVFNFFTDAVFDGVGGYDGGFTGRVLNRVPNTSQPVSRTVEADPNGEDDSAYAVTNDGRITFSNVDGVSGRGFTVSDGSFYALELAEVQGGLTSPTEIDHAIQLGVKVNAAAPDLSNTRYRGEVLRVCYGAFATRLERMQQLLVEFSADGSQMFPTAETRSFGRFSDDAGFTEDDEFPEGFIGGGDGLAVTTSPNGGFSAIDDDGGLITTFDGALSANGRIIVLRYSLDNTINFGDNCEGFGIVGRETGQEIINSRPIILSLESSQSTVTKGAQVTLTVDAPDNDPLTINWVATVGELSSTTGISVTWTAPAAGSPDGTARIYATASDGDLPATSSVDIEYTD